ncbi:MAG: transposase family protein, partial [Verrucomicrobiales bacterium]
MPNPSDFPDPPSVSPLELLRDRFARMPDARREGHVLHRIDEVLLIAFCSMLSDNDAFTDMETFGKTQIQWLRTFRPLPHGPPSHDVFRNVFIALRPQALLDILADWCGDLAGRQIKID